MPRAVTLYREGLRLHRLIEHPVGMVAMLEALAGALSQGETVRAVRLYGASARLRRTLGVPLPANDWEDYARGTATARALLGDAGFAAMQAVSEAMSLEQAITEALEIEGGGTTSGDYLSTSASLSGRPEPGRRA